MYVSHERIRKSHSRACAHAPLPRVLLKGEHREERVDNRLRGPEKLLMEPLPLLIEESSSRFAENVLYWPSVRQIYLSRDADIDEVL